MFQDYEDRRLPVRQNQNENPANPNPPREDPPAADGQGGGRGDDQRIPRADGAEPRQDNPLEQLIGNPLFQAMARAPTVNAVGNCRLPALWHSDPDLWFLQVEAQFNIHQVTSDSTRFNMILTVLDPETISEVSDIIRAPPAQDRYTTLKDAIVARLTDSPDTQLHKLLGTIELGDKKPSQLLLQMRTLAGPRASNDILRVRWLDLLPDSTRRLLTIIKNQTIDELAAVADELHAVGPSVMATEVGRPRSRPASPGGAASSNSNSVGAQEIAELRAAIVQLTEITREALQRRDQPREARPRGTAGTTRDTATWQSSAEARALARVFTPQGPSGKLGVLTLHSAPAVSITIERRLYVTDRTHKIRFLIDSGSVLSILPRTVVRKPLQRKTLELQAANGTTIVTYGQHSLTLNLGLRRPFEWAFTIARVDVAIIGADLLSHFGLLIDLRNRRLLDNQTSLSTSCQVGPAPQVHTISVAATGVPVGPCVAYDAILAEFASDKARPRPDSPSLPALGASPAIDSRPRRPNSRSCSIGGIIRLSSSQWASPLHLVPKPGNTWRITGDYRLLNARTQPDRHPLPIIEDLLQESVGKVFSVVDLYKAFLPDPGRRRRHLEDGRHDTFRPLRVSHDELPPPAGSGLRALLPGRHPRALSASHEQHLQHLRELLTILKRARLFVNWEKCQIGRSEVVFAGYLISERGFEPPAAKVEAIARFPKPSDSTQLRRFIGMLNFYRRCLPRAAELMSPLTDLLRGLQKKKEKLAWSAQADEAFERIKQAMASAELNRCCRRHDVCSLTQTTSEEAFKTINSADGQAVRSAFYHPGQPLALHTDASNTAIGAALSQRHATTTTGRRWVFFSQKLSPPTQQRYSTYDRELLAIFEAIKYFSEDTRGSKLHHHDRSSPSVLRPRAEVGQVLASTVTSARLHLALRCQDRFTRPATRTQRELKLHDVVIDGLSLVCVRAAKRPEAIPTTRESTSTGFRQTAHTLSHPSGRATVNASRAAILLAVDEQDIVRWAKQCVPCQQSKVHRHTTERNWEISSHRTADSIMCTSTSSRCLFTKISKLPHDDRPLHTLATGHPDRRHVCTNRSQSIFFHGAGFHSFFGTPLTITTDQGVHSSKGSSSLSYASSSVQSTSTQPVPSSGK
ncbi:unnamed protein product [Trichogramma brassicae]|uniref:RNA-directed DNA polymerase n=1 Tax=Trichogramma brassicae TaxID=86971 RepID=A0A6H5IH40_9HYME|nr:unnamed protein product [Trichogramma brassicae]